MHDAHEDQEGEGVGKGNRGRCDHKTGRCNQRHTARANPVGYPACRDRKNQNREAIGTEYQTRLAIRQTKLVVPDRNQRNRGEPGHHVEEDQRRDQRCQTTGRYRPALTHHQLS